MPASVAVLVDRATGQQRAIDEGPVALVVPQLVRHHVVGHVEVDAPIFVEVAADDSQAVAEGEPEASGERDVLERAVPAVAVDEVARRGVVAHRAAVVESALGRMAVALALGRPAQVVRHEEIERAVGVGVEPGRARAPGGIAQASPRRVVLQATVFVAEERVRADVGDEHIHVSVRVRIAARDAHAVARVGAAQLGRGIHERQATSVAEDLVGELGTRARKIAALHEIHVDRAILVDVEQADSAAHDLGEPESLLLAAHVLPVEALLRRHGAEPGRGGFRPAARGQGKQSQRQRA